MRHWFTYIFSVCICFINGRMFSQNELYIKSVDQFYNNGALIYVNGEINNNNGLVTNNTTGIYTGIIELTGNWNNTITSANYVSTGIERFSGTANQLITGTWNGTSGNTNQFYNLKINKTTGYVSLAQDTYVNGAGAVAFESSGGIIRTATVSSSNTGDYTYILYVQNPSTAALTGYNFPSGTTKYIEGKLKRQVNSAGTYEFPVGFQPADKDGMEPYKIKFNSAPASTGIVGYIRPAATAAYFSDLITNGDILFYDIGAYISPNNNFSQCTGGADGHDDAAQINMALTHEWMVTPDAISSVDYDMTVFPGPLLDNISYAAIGSACNSLYTQAKYLARDGRIGGDQSVGPTTNFSFPGVTGLYQAPTGNTIKNQTGFSRFRLFGATDNNTTLPVELMQFAITAVNNQYFLLNWATASENNNAGFEVERCDDSLHFSKIGWVQGHGNSSMIERYQFDDKDVVVEKNYYYRLKQIDKEGKITYSRIVTSRLRGENIFSISPVYPNPVNDEASIDIYAPEPEIIKIEFIDILGQQMQQLEYQLSQGWNKIKLEAGSLAAGTYVLNFNYKEQQYTKRLVKK
ncbi:MAG: lipoprotein [Bacteroidota bacterium]|nr:lipoprotein [Bacteroidota bacterium]